MTTPIGFISTLLLCMIQVAYGAHFAHRRPDQKDPCIMMDADFSLLIIKEMDGKVVARDKLFSEDKNIDVMGLCGETSATLNLVFREDVMWSFLFTNKDNLVELRRLVMFTPSEIFSGTTQSDQLTFDNPHTVTLSHTNESFVCTERSKTEYIPRNQIPGNTKFRVETKFIYFKVQAFGLKQGEYSPSVSCPSGNRTSPTTTTTPQTTTTTTPIVIPTKTPDNIYEVTNPENTTVCIALAGEIDVDIWYQYNTTDGVIKTRAVSFAIPRNATSYGNCTLKDGTQKLFIEFFEPFWTLEFIFKRNYTKSSRHNGLLETTQERLDYRIKRINLIYVNDPDRFPGSILPDGQRVLERSTESEKYYPHKSEGKDYYTCSSEINMKINKHAAITTSKFKFKAFNTDNDRSFDGFPSQCLADNSHDSYAAIVVTCVIAVLIVIVCIIVVISIVTKRRQQRQRQQRQQQPTHQQRYYEIIE